MKQAERNAARQTTLAAKGIAATAALDNATRDMDVAKADIAVAKAQIENAKAQIAQREAQLEQAQIDLERTIIRSPIDGTVIGRTVDIGQTVAASLQAPELFKIAQDLRRIRIEAQVNEADVGAVAEGNPVSFTVDAYPEMRFSGIVTQVRLAATELQNVVTYTVIIEAANTDRKLFPGMTANVQIETARRDGVARLPMDALRFKPRNLSGSATGTAAPAAGRASPEERERRMAELADSLKSDIGLNEEQITKVRAELAKSFRGNRGGGQPGAGAPSGGGEGPGGGAAPDPAQIRARMLARTTEAVAAVITSDQRPKFEAWKRARESARTASIWILGAAGAPESRQIRIGIADDQFAEVLGATVTEADRVIIRAREVKK
jgi:HlyD family secretion protein